MFPVKDTHTTNPELGPLWLMLSMKILWEAGWTWRILDSTWGSWFRKPGVGPRGLIFSELSRWFPCWGIPWPHLKTYFPRTPLWDSWCSQWSLIHQKRWFFSNKIDIQKDECLKDKDFSFLKFLKNRVHLNYMEKSVKWNHLIPPGVLLY